MYPRVWRPRWTDVQRGLLRDPIKQTPEVTFQDGDQGSWSATLLPSRSSALQQKTAEVFLWHLAFKQLASPQVVGFEVTEGVHH